MTSQEDPSTSPEKASETTNEPSYISPTQNQPMPTSTPEIAGVGASLKVDSNGFVAEPLIDDSKTVDEHEPFQSQQAPSFMPKKSSKRLIVIIASAVAVVLLGSASVFAFYYNTPVKSVSDAFSQTLGLTSLKSQGTLTIDNVDKTSPNIKLTYDLAMNNTSFSDNSEIGVLIDGKTTTVKASIVATKDTIALKMVNFRDLLTSFMGSVSGGAISLDPYNSLINKIDNKWVVVTKDDLNQYTNNTGVDTQTTCAQDAFATFRTSKTQQNEITDLYKNNQFVNVSKTLGTETINGKLSNHYELTVDNKKAQTFGNKLPTTTVFKAIDTCYKGQLTTQFNDNIDKNTPADTKTTTKTDLWVDMLSHTPTKLKVTTSDTSSTFTFESFLQFNSAPQIVVPKADTTFKDLQTEIETLQKTTFSGIESSLNTSVTGI